MCAWATGLVPVGADDPRRMFRPECAQQCGDLGHTSAGTDRFLGLRTDGTVAVWVPADWGRRFSLVATPPGLTNVVAIAAGSYINVVLKADGTLATWGTPTFPLPTTIKPGDSEIVAIAAGAAHVLALREDGSVQAWGNSGSVTNIPASFTNGIAVAAANDSSLFLSRDGRVLALANRTPASGIPSGITNAVDIAAGYGKGLALLADGTVAIGGTYAEDAMPPGLNNVVQRERLRWHRGPPSPWPATSSRSSPAAHSAAPQMPARPSASGLTRPVSGPIAYQWRFNGTNLPAATTLLPLVVHHPTR